MSGAIIYLDTETTGLKPEEGNRIISIGCVKVVDGEVVATFTSRFNPEGRKSLPGAFQTHGITDEELLTEPTFKEKADELLAFLGDAKIVIHNAPFDLGFLNSEFGLLGKPPIEGARVEDTKAMAAELIKAGVLLVEKTHLDVLCRQFGIDRGLRDARHNSLEDAHLVRLIHPVLKALENQIDRQSKPEGPGAVERLNQQLQRDGTLQR